MKIMKELNEIRITTKVENVNDGFRTVRAKCMYISKYESSIKCKEQTDNTVVFLFTSSCSTFLNRERRFEEPYQTTREIRVPKVCIEGDVESDSFKITDAFIRKVDVLTRLVPYAERGYRHKNEYRVMELQEFENRLASKTN